MRNEKLIDAIALFDKDIFANSPSQLRLIIEAARENEQLRYDLEFVWKCVERAKWNPKIFGKPETAIENMVLYPNAPWNNKERWNWDTSHKEYDADIKNYVVENEQLRKERDELAELILMIEDGSERVLDEDEWNSIIKMCREAKG